MVSGVAKFDIVAVTGLMSITIRVVLFFYPMSVLFRGYSKSSGLAEFVPGISPLSAPPKSLLSTMPSPILGNLALRSLVGRTITTLCTGHQSYVAD